jgi:DNA-binding CsgD family transcriptional regulator
MISKPFYSDEFVGRREELAFLREEFRYACESRARLVIVDGEPGIGKSRLLAEFLRAVEPEATVGAGRCSEYVRAPYLPLSEIVDSLDPRSRVAALRPRDQGSPSEEKWAYFSAVVDLIRAQCARRPLVLAVEDAQWADGASIDLLRFILSRIAAARCMIVITMRTEPLGTDGAGAAIRAAAARYRGASVQLRGLRRYEIKHMVQTALRARDASIDPAMIAQIEVLAEGNPLFAEELARIALESGGLSFETHMPVTLQAILNERLAQFTTLERGTLYRAASIGESFDADLLAAVADLPRDDVLQVVERAASVDLLQEPQPGRFSFRHALIRQALADQLLVSLAAPLHMRIATQLETLPDARKRAPELAYHWSAARVPDKARMWNEAAAQAAWDVYAYRDAIRFYTDALHWNYPEGSARAAICERLGTLLYIDGCGEEPARWFARSREEYERCGNDLGAAHALLLEADQHWVDARTPQAAELSARAAALLKRLGHVQMYAQALLGVARFAITLGQVERSLAYLDAAKAYRDRFDAGSRAMWHEVSGEVHAALGNAAHAVAEFRAAARLAAEAGAGELISQIENNFALGAFDLGDLELAAARHQIAVDEAHRTGLMWRIAYCSLNYARTLMCKGELERARTLVWDAVQTGVTTATFRTKAASVGIPVGLRTNDRALLNACADENALELAHRSGEIQRIASVTAAFAALRIAQGSDAEARATIGRAIRRIPHAHRSWDLFVAAAQWGDPEDVTLARRMLDSAMGRPAVCRAYRLLFQSIAQPHHADSLRVGRLAAKHFAQMGNRLYDDLLTHKREDVAKPASALTPRQWEIAKLVAGGATNREIAEDLHISEHTVEHHLSGIFERLNLRSRTQLAHLLGRESAI